MQNPLAFSGGLHDGSWVTVPDPNELLFRQTQKLADLMRELRVVESVAVEATRQLKQTRSKIRSFLIRECNCFVVPWRKPNAENARRKAKAAAVALAKRKGDIHGNGNGDNLASKIVRLDVGLSTSRPKGRRGVRRGDAA